jgi:hypothetical protein
MALHPYYVQDMNIRQLVAGFNAVPGRGADLAADSF